MNLPIAVNVGTQIKKLLITNETLFPYVQKKILVETVLIEPLNFLNYASQLFPTVFLLLLTVSICLLYTVLPYFDVNWCKNKPTYILICADLLKTLSARFNQF